MAALAAPIHVVTGQHGELAGGAPGSSGADVAAPAAAEHRLQLEVVQLPAAKRGGGWLPTVLAGWPVRACACLVLHRVIPLMASSYHALAIAYLMLHQLIHLYSSP